MKAAILLLLVLLVAPFVYAESTGKLYPTSYSEYQSGTSFTNSNNMLADDSNYASCALGTVVEYCRGSIVSNFNIPLIPYKASITNVDFSVQRYVSGASTQFEEIDAVLYLNSAAIGTDKATNDVIPNGEAVQSFSGNSAYWGITLNNSLINDETFGFGYRAYKQSSASGQTLYIDYINLEVDFERTAPNETVYVLATDTQTGSFPSNFSVTVFNSTYTSTNHSVNGEMNFTQVNGLMNLTVSADGYLNQTVQHRFSYDNNSYSFVLSPENTLNTTFYDEIPATLLTYEVDVELIGPTNGSSISTSTGSHKFTDLEAGDYEVRYKSDLYKQRSYFITIADGTVTQTDLYLLSLGNSTDIEVTVQDGSGSKLEDAEVRLKRYYVATNSYTTVAMAKTDFEGVAILDVDFDDAFYQIEAISDGYTTQTSGSKIFNTEITITVVKSADPFTQIDVANDVSTSLTFNNNSQTYSYTFTSMSGTEREGVIEVIEYDGNTNGVVCRNTATSSSATILCEVNVTNSNSTFVANGYVNEVGSSQLIRTDTLESLNYLKEQFLARIGGNGLFLSVIFAGTTAGLGLANPAIAIVLFLAGLSSMIFIGFSAISIATFVTISILGFLVIWRIRG